MNIKQIFSFTIIFTLVALMCFSFAVAVQITKTPISVSKMEKRVNFTLNVLDADTSEIMQTVEGRTDGAGTYTFTNAGGGTGYYSFDVANINLAFEINKDGEISKKEFGPYPVGTEINIEYNSEFDNDVPSASTDLPDEASIVSDDAQESAGSITGRAVDSSETNGRPSNLFFYILGAIVLLGGIVLLVLRSSRNSQAPQEGLIPVSPSVAPSMDQKPMTPQDKYDVMMAQKRIRDLESEVTRLKNQEKITQIERNIAREKSELDKLRMGKI